MLRVLYLLIALVAIAILLSIEGDPVCIGTPSNDIHCDQYYIWHEEASR